VRKKSKFLPDAKPTSRTDDKYGDAFDAGDSRPLQSSEWLNHATDSKTTDIFGDKQRSRKRRAMRLVGSGLAMGGKGLIKAGKFGYRQMRPMRARDWVTLSAVAAVFVALGVYATFERGAGLPRSQLGCRWHTVDVGDSLISLARIDGVSVEDIARANGIFDVKDPPIGMQLCIPSKSDVAQAAGSTPFASATDGPVIQGEAAYVRFALPYAQQAHEATGWPTSVILAQWGLEQGWEAPTFTGYNFGNCGGLIDEPFVPGTSAPGSPSTFAYADSPEDGVRFYIQVAKLSYYNQIASAARSGGPEAAAKALGASPWDAGHYTANNDPGSSLIALMKQYNLTQYD
jgi:LysM domain